MEGSGFKGSVSSSKKMKFNTWCLHIWLSIFICPTNMESNCVFFGEEEDIFLRIAASNYTRLSASFSTPQGQYSGFFLVFTLPCGFVTFQSLGNLEICAAISSSVLVCSACKISSYVGLETYKRFMLTEINNNFIYAIFTLITDNWSTNHYHRHINNIMNKI